MVFEMLDVAQQLTTAFGMAAGIGLVTEESLKVLLSMAPHVFEILYQQRVRCCYESSSSLMPNGHCWGSKSIGDGSTISFSSKSVFGLGASVFKQQQVSAALYHLFRLGSSTCCT